MFDITDLFQATQLSKQKSQIAKQLNVSVESLEAFEKAYSRLEESNNKKETVQMTKNNPSTPDDLVKRIVNELVQGCKIVKCKDEKITERTIERDNIRLVTLDEINSLPKEIRPELTGQYMKRDVDVPAYIQLMDHLITIEKEKNPEKRKMHYDIFRQGLDILDLDTITYKMLDCNKNSMGYWLPRIADAVKKEGFFRIPDTVIAKVPLPMLQLTRLEYSTHTRTTLNIVNQWAQQVFELSENKKYFIKTGTYSSKFDFRNAKVTDSEEIKEIGEYLLYIHTDALRMAHYDLQGRRPIMYGISTTNEWVVRDFIEDEDNAFCIYHGLPLHTEYRVFVDFDNKEVLGIHSYWDSEVMKNRFDNYSDNISPDMLHDSVTYRAQEPILMKKYNASKDIVADHIKKILLHCTEMTGQWSIDIMLNGNTFWLIDMAVAENSAYYEYVPKQKRHRMKESWIPLLK
ncbi:MAG: hypothetical protein IJ192_08930 [Clostridia bacterium]|nr:hypothetical protein [Clostridia bacterium]